MTGPQHETVFAHHHGFPTLLPHTERSYALEHAMILQFMNLFYRLVVLAVVGIKDTRKRNNAQPIRRALLSSVHARQQFLLNRIHPNMSSDRGNTLACFRDPSGSIVTLVSSDLSNELNEYLQGFNPAKVANWAFSQTGPQDCPEHTAILKSE